jgi:zeaxanthin glucosyltransferase
MRMGVGTVPATGHLNAMTALARRLSSRGHEVTFICMPDGERAARDAGLRFEALCALECPVGFNDDNLRKLSALTGREALQFTMQALGSVSEAVLQRLPPILQSKFDGVVVDSALFGASAAARLARVPFATIFCTPILDLSGGMPPWQFPWPYEDSDAARQRNLAGVDAILKFAAPAYRIQLEHLKRAGIQVDESDYEWVRSPLACITQVPAAFDFPGGHLPPHYHRTGPFHDGLGRTKVPFPWERLTGEPLIYASMGTVQNGLLDVFRIILQATERAGYQVVLSVGPNIAVEELRTRMPSTIVVPQVPQVELLKLAALCVTHAGLNTTLEALAQGVPLVAIPITNDQPGVAARILASGSGLFVPLTQLTAEALGEMVDAVVANPGYRQRALALQAAIQSLDGLTMASKIIETAFASATRTS